MVHSYGLLFVIKSYYWLVVKKEILVFKKPYYCYLQLVVVEKEKNYLSIYKKIINRRLTK